MTRQQLLNIKGIHNVFTFGKFKGKTILQVLDKNPSYLVWCIRNVKGFSIEPDLEKELCRQYDEYYRKYELAKVNGYISSDVKLLMEKPHNMYVTEAMDFLEYDVPEPF